MKERQRPRKVPCLTLNEIVQILRSAEVSQAPAALSIATFLIILTSSVRVNYRLLAAARAPDSALAEMNFYSWLPSSANTLWAARKGKQRRPGGRERNRLSEMQF